MAFICKLFQSRLQVGQLKPYGVATGLVHVKMTAVFITRVHVWQNLFQSGAHKCTSKDYRKYLWFESGTVTSQALKYDVNTFTPYEGVNYTILDEIHHYENVSVNHLKFK